ncbi:MAG: acetate kinase [Synechococcaceae cyanobacterium]
MSVAVLVLNAGSSSLKACVIDARGTCLWRDQRPWHPDVEGAAEVVANGVAEAEGQAAPTANAVAGSPSGSLEAVLAEWLPAALEPWLDRLGLVGHRVVHGGERFVAPTRLTPLVLAELQALLPLAPLHNGPALWAIRWLGERWPQLEAWACFDTAFHADLPPAARTYALPEAWRANGQRRYGFHGLNHQHISEVVAAQPWAAAYRPLRLISCHLGAGCSVAAIRDGRSIATTMGFTPLEGVVMASRSGSIDPGLLLHLLRHRLSVAELDAGLNRSSGLLGLSGLSGDMARLRQAAAEGHGGAQLAIDVFRHSLLQAIGAMAASLNGVDCLALSGGIGFHDQALQGELRQALAWLEPLRWQVIPADEEGVIARSCLEAAGRESAGQR